MTKQKLEFEKDLRSLSYKLLKSILRMRPLKTYQSKLTTKFKLIRLFFWHLPFLIKCELYISFSKIL